MEHTYLGTFVKSLRFRYKRLDMKTNHYFSPETVTLIQTEKRYNLCFKVKLNGTIRKDDFQPKTGLQCWNHVVTIQNNVATMLLRCVALISSLEIVSCNIHL